MQDKDAEAIREACARGDVRAATAALLESFGPEILGYMQGMHRDPDVADDVFSLFCERVYASIGRFEWRCSARTWAYVLARRAALDYARREDRRAQRVRAFDGDSELSAVAARVRTETSLCLRTDTKRAVRELRERLPEEDRVLLVLRVDRQLSWLDLARVFQGDVECDEEAITRESARLRKRFQLIKEQLRAWCQEAGIVP
jgi:RNA polymerase sigma-70 factor (ECF subfamily)